jgi:enoyl-CoA hydratase/carnithine racemase
MPYETLAVERRGPVGWLVFDRPDAANAMDATMLAELETAWRELDADPDVRVIVNTGNGDAFQTGLDVRQLARDKAALREQSRRTRDAELRLTAWHNRVWKPVIAAVNGVCAGGAFLLAAACDLRFAADDEGIKIGASEMKLFGVMPSGGGGTQYLTRLMGPSRALAFLLEAEQVSPARALELGIVERLLPADSLVEDAQAFAARLAGRAGRVGLNAAKRLTLDAASLPLPEALELDAEVHWDSMRRGGFVPGVDAFVARFGS